MTVFICQCGCEVKVNDKGDQRFVLCLDCGHYGVDPHKSDEKDKMQSSQKILVLSSS